MTERDEFEKWCDLTERDLTDLDLFAAWQASRLAALEEAWEAVHGERLEDPTETHGDMAYERAIADCENAIRALSQK